MELSFFGDRDLVSNAACSKIDKAVAALCTPRMAPGKPGMMPDTHQSMSQIRSQLGIGIMESGSDSNTALAQSETFWRARGFVTSVLASE